MYTVTVNDFSTPVLGLVECGYSSYAENMKCNVKMINTYIADTCRCITDQKCYADVLAYGFSFFSPHNHCEPTEELLHFLLTFNIILLSSQ